MFTEVLTWTWLRKILVKSESSPSEKTPNTSGHDGSMCNAYQCGSMCDQTLSIVSQLRSLRINANQYGSILIKSEALIHIDPY